MRRKSNSKRNCGRSALLQQKLSFKVAQAVRWVPPADHDKVYAFVQDGRGICYLQGYLSEEKAPIGVSERGFSVRLGSEYPTFGSLEKLRDGLKTRGYLGASAMEAEIEEVKNQLQGMKKFPSEEAAREALIKQAKGLESNQAVCAVVMQDGIPTKFLVTKDGEKIETKDFNHTYFQNIEARLKKAGFGWTSLLQEDLHVSSIGYDLG